MSARNKKSKPGDISVTTLAKSSTPKQPILHYLKLKKGSEKVIRLPNEISIKGVHQEKRPLEKGLQRNISTTSSRLSLRNETAPDNGFSAHDGIDMPFGTYGKDWDEMEFLENGSLQKYMNIKDLNITTTDALNGKYARTRKNLGQKMSSDVNENGLVKKRTLQSSKTDDKHLSSNNMNSGKPKLKKLTKRDALVVYPVKSVTSLNSSLGKAGSSTEDRPTRLLDMVKKFSVGPSSDATDTLSCKTFSTPKSSSSLVKYLNKIRSEPPRAKSVTDVSVKKLPNSLEISVVPSSLKSSVKLSNSSAENVGAKDSVQVKKLSYFLNSQQVEEGCPQFETKEPCPRKRNSESIRNVVKKRKILRNGKTNHTREATCEAPLNDSSKNNVAIADHVTSPPDEEIIQDSNDPNEGDSSDANSVPQVTTLNSGLGNESVLNTTPTSYVFGPSLSNSFTNVTPSLPNSFSNVTPSLPNSFSNVTPSLPNSFSNVTPSLPNTFSTVAQPLSNFVSPTASNVIFDVNSMYPPIVNQPSTTVFILPVASNFCALPNAASLMGSLNTPLSAQPIIRVACNGMDPDTVFKSLYKNFYQSPATAFGNSNNFTALNTIANNSTTQTNSLVNTTLSASSSVSHQLETCGNNLLIPSATRHNVQAVNTIDRSSLVLSYFCEIMKNRPKLPLEEYRKKADEMLDVLSSFPHYLSVKYFRRITEEYFSDLCFRNTSSQITRFKVEPNFEDSSLNVIVKKYVSFQVKEIIKSFPAEPFCVKSTLIFKARNSKLTYFEKLILKKMLKGNQEVELEELIGRLFFVGLVVVFSLLKKQKQA